MYVYIRIYAHFADARARPLLIFHTGFQNARLLSAGHATIGHFWTVWNIR